MEITYNYVDRGVLSTKNMNYGENIQKLINDEGCIKKWKNLKNQIFSTFFSID